MDLKPKALIGHSNNTRHLKEEWVLRGVGTVSPNNTQGREGRRSIEVSRDIFCP
jgi:hypothetical protein